MNEGYKLKKGEDVTEPRSILLSAIFLFHNEQG